MRSITRQATLLLCAVALVVSAGSASARPAHKSKNQAAVAAGSNDPRSPNYRPYPLPGQSRVVGGSKSRQANAAVRSSRRAHTGDAFGGFTTNALVAEARKYIGTNPTGRRSLWCGAFMDFVLKRTGHPGGGNLG